MGKLINAGTVADFTDGSMKKVSAEGLEILLARVGSNYFAVSNRCPHMAGDLSAGKLEGTVITCPRHGSQFDITSGKNIRWLKGSGLMSSIGKMVKQPQPLTAYKVKIDGDTISIEV